MENFLRKCQALQVRLQEAQKELAALKKELAELEKKGDSSELDVSDILTFFHSSSRAANDKTNKIREKILQNLSNVNPEFFDHPEYGSQWSQLSKSWIDVLSTYAASQGIMSFDRTVVQTKAGRMYNYDYDVRLFSGDRCEAAVKVEFKYGASSINDLPQFLSLPSKFPELLDEEYSSVWYHEYLDKYIALDSGLSEPKPSFEVYKKEVVKNESKHPFFLQLKEKEEFQIKEKHEIVNQSITEFLTRNIPTLQLKTLLEKIEESQKDKVYLLWSNGKFHIDTIPLEKLKTLSFDSISNGNTIQLRGDGVGLSLLLRWRNHKGILNPAWQIRIKKD